MRLVILSCALVFVAVANALAQSDDVLPASNPPAVDAVAVVAEQPQVQSAPIVTAQASAPAQQAVEAVQPEAIGAYVLNDFKEVLGESGLKNITDVEQVFCYELADKPNGYQGYTLNNMALKGFCGVLNKELAMILVNQLLETPENVSFNTSEDCTINPKIMLRFIRGIDSTDILLSSPCHSIAIFYGGNVKAFNMRPGSELIDTVVAAFGKNRIDFVSPALLNQMLPVGIAQTPEQQSLVESKRGTQPVRNWGANDQPQTSDEPKKSGWNNLNM